MWIAHDGMGWWMLFGGLWMVGFWGAIIALVVWGVKKLSERGKPEGESREKQEPLDIPKGQHARGEITKEDFERMKRDCPDEREGVPNRWRKEAERHGVEMGLHDRSPRSRALMS